jgi:hypothetical protein
VQALPHEVVFEVQSVAVLDRPSLHLEEAETFEVGQGVLDGEQPIPARLATELPENPSS